MRSSNTRKKSCLGRFFYTLQMVLLLFSVSVVNMHLVVVSFLSLRGQSSFLVLSLLQITIPVDNITIQ